MFVLSFGFLVDSKETHIAGVYTSSGRAQDALDTLRGQLVDEWGTGFFLWISEFKVNAEPEGLE